MDRRADGKLLLIVASLLCLANWGALAEGTPAATELDATLVLPPPPAPGSALAAADLAELHRLQMSSSPAQLAAAAYDDQHEDGTIFAPVLGPSYDLGKLPQTARLLAAVNAAEETATKPAKAYFHRDRPWIVDPAIKTCTPHKPGPAANTYPSGHATVGFAMAEVLAALMPQKSQAILARATAFAENRLICGYHFRSDIVAGQEFGSLLALHLMQSPAFAAQMAAAKAELQAANLTP
jgi:acid phosphatase (class A)